MFHQDAGRHLIHVLVSFIFFEWMAHYASPWILRHLPATKNFSNLQRAEFQTRTISVGHAIIVTVFSMYAFIADEESKRDMIWGDSWIIRTTLAISVGYFVTDLLLISKDVVNIGGGWGYVWHHISALWPYSLVITLGCLPYFANFRLMAEISTPFVNARWYYHITGRKDSEIYYYNGLILTFTFFVSRIIAMPYYYYLVYTVWHTEEFERLGLMLQLSWLLPCIILDILNIAWFWKLMRGAQKVLKSRKSAQIANGTKTANGHSTPNGNAKINEATSADHVVKNDRTTGGDTVESAKTTANDRLKTE